MTDFVWLSDEYSVPIETLCMHEPPAPNRDFRCIRAAGHPGKHRYSMDARVRPYSHKEKRPD